jgi:hypothetical protein
MKSDLKYGGSVHAMHSPVAPPQNPWGGELIGIKDHDDTIQVELMVDGEPVVMRTKWYREYAVTWASKTFAAMPFRYRADGEVGFQPYIGWGKTEQAAVCDLARKAGGATLAPRRPGQAQ